MAGQTPRFALNYFGGTVEGSLEDDGEKFTGEDRLTLDAILSALEKHTHRPTTQLAVPDDIPDVEFDTGGNLLGGTTYHYVVSFVNGDGLETVAGPETSITLPDDLSTPDAPSVETTDTPGVLTAGVYYYALSGLRDTEESAQGDYSLVTILDNDDTSVLITLPPLSDATSWQIWRQKETDPQWTRIATTTDPTYTDLGAVPAAAYGDPANIPLDLAAGADNYQVTITLTGSDLSTVTTARSWRIYRSDISGVYSAASLVHDVVEHTNDLDPTSPLLIAWVDDGDIALTGSPKLQSTQLLIPPFTFEQANPLPATTAYPNNYPILDGSGTLYINKAGTWTAVGGTPRGVPFMGVWDPAVIYQATDVAIDSNKMWKAISPAYGVAPAAGPWTLLADFTPWPAPGFRYTYDWQNQNMDTDPGTGVLRFDNSAPLYTDAITLSTTTADGQAMSNSIQSWDDSTDAVKGFITIRNAGVGYHRFRLDSIGTVDTAWIHLNVYHVAGDMTNFAIDTTVYVSFDAA